MSFAMLQYLADQPLPTVLADPADIDALHALVLAGLVTATIPDPVRKLAGYEQPLATVTGITRMGRNMLKKFPLR